VHGLRDLEIRAAGVDEPRDLPAVRERLELAERAEISQEAACLVARAQRQHGVREVVQPVDVLDRMRGLARRLISHSRHVSMLTRCKKRATGRSSYFRR